MKNPSLEEVKEYFKGAETVESVFRNEFEIGEIYECDGDFLGREKETESSSHTIWMSCKGYAKILTYKNNDMKITKEFIKANADKTLKEVFPEVCAPVLEVGKWYRRDKKGWELFLFCFSGNYGNETQYGFDALGEYKTTLGVHKEEKYFESTNEEVFKALKAEWKRLGGGKGAHFKTPVNGFSGFDNEEYFFTDNMMFSGSKAIFNKGRFATIIPTITKEEAEKLLNKKIV